MMNSQSKTQTETNVSVIDFSKLSTSKEHPMHEAVEELLKPNKKGYSNDSSTYTLVPFVANNFSKTEENRMNENDMLKAYMEKVDRDQSDLRADIRESERRTSEKIDKIEERMDSRLNRIEDMIKEVKEDNAASVKEIDKKVKSNLGWIVATCITTILGIAGMVITVVVSTFAGGVS